MNIKHNLLSFAVIGLCALSAAVAVAFAGHVVMDGFVPVTIEYMREVSLVSMFFGTVFALAAFVVLSYGIHNRSSIKQQLLELSERTDTPMLCC